MFFTPEQIDAAIKFVVRVILLAALMFAIICFTFFVLVGALAGLVIGFIAHNPGWGAIIGMAAGALACIVWFELRERAFHREMDAILENWKIERLERELGAERLELSLQEERNEHQSPPPLLLDEPHNQ